MPFDVTRMTCEKLSSDIDECPGRGEVTRVAHRVTSAPCCDLVHDDAATNCGVGSRLRTQVTCEGKKGTAKSSLMRSPIAVELCGEVFAQRPQRLSGSG